MTSITGTPSITGIIAALTGEEAIRVLADTADYQNRLPDPAQLRPSNRPTRSHR